MEVSVQLHAPAALPPSERAPGTNWIGGWVGPRAVLDTVDAPTWNRTLEPRSFLYRNSLKE
jgi:hypothetical protein